VRSAAGFALKKEKAAEILHDRNLRVSVQVLQEFYLQATRQSRPDPLSHDQALGLVQSLLRYPVQDNTSAVTLAAMETRARFGLSYWDAAVVEAARASGCSTLLSEDLSDGSDYDGVQVENPFRGL
jgi:predicted nucleic acid-binding protein